MLSSYGDPWERSTYSGTARGIVEALQNLEAPFLTHDVSLAVPPTARYVYSGLNTALGLGPRFPYRVGVWHHRARRLAEAVVRKYGDEDYLHIGWDHLPLSAALPGRHFLFTDYTKHLMANEHVRAAEVTARHRRVVMRQERQTMQRLSRVFSASRYVASQLTSVYGVDPTKIDVVGTGFRDLGASRNAILSKDFGRRELIFVAKHSFNAKGGDLLMRSLDSIFSRNPGARLTVIGNYKDPEQDSWRTRLSSDSRVHYLDWDVPDFGDRIRRASLFVAPAPSEPYGLVYLEAMGAGTPIVACNQGAIPDFTDEGRLGFVTETRTPEAVAAAVTRALSSVTDLRRIAVAGHDYVQENYSWDRVASAVLKAATT